MTTVIYFHHMQAGEQGTAWEERAERIDGLHIASQLHEIFFPPFWLWGGSWWGEATISVLISAGRTEEVLIYAVELREIRPLTLENEPTKEAKVNS